MRRKLGEQLRKSVSKLMSDEARARGKEAEKSRRESGKCQLARVKGKKNDALASCWKKSRD